MLGIQMYVCIYVCVCVQIVKNMYCTLVTRILLKKTTF